MSSRDLAGLFFLCKWQDDTPEVNLADGVRLCRTEGSIVGRLYERLCAEEGIDDGDPYSYYTHVLIDRPYSKGTYFFIGDPHSTFDRVCNVISIVTGEPTAMCRIIESQDAFANCFQTYLGFDFDPDVDILHKYNQVIDAATAVHICTSWNTASQYWEEYGVKGRIGNALTYYYFAWRSRNPEQTCINLAIVLELLFAPSTTTEVSHQIAFNVSRFLGNTRETREEVYTKVKRFYRTRSQIIHGSVPDYHRVNTDAVEAFQLCTSILQRLMLSPDMANEFNDDTKRKELLSTYLFT